MARLKPQNAHIRQQKNGLLDGPDFSDNGTINPLLQQFPRLPTYTGNYGNVDAGNWQSSPGPFANRYQVTPDGRVMQNPGYYSDPFAGRPTMPDVRANPDAYGVDPNDLPPVTPPPQTNTGGGGGLPPSGGAGGGGMTPPTNLPTPGGGGSGGIPPATSPYGPGGGLGGATGGPQPIGGGGGGGPGLALPAGITSMENTLAAYGMMRGPNGEIVPIMLKQGMNPYQVSPSMQTLPGFGPGMLGANGTPGLLG